MNNLLHLATTDLAKFLETTLPQVSPDWWQKHVVARLSFQQQRTLQERSYTSLHQLDFAALLRLVDQNWHDLSNTLTLPQEFRTWVKELQTVRNKWAHLTAAAMPASEIYRDADTLSRVLTKIGASPASIKAVEAAKTAAVAAMAKAAGGAPSATAEPPHSPPPATPPVSPLPPEPVAPPASNLFKVGDLVALRSNSALVFPVIEVIPGAGECRYRVFQNNAKATYYQSQLRAPPVSSDTHRSITAQAMRAHLTSYHLLSPSTTNLFSLRSGRVQFVPYQYRPVLKLIRSDRPRLLIADEVGVGKTIEAGLIIKELRARMDLSSVLIICPKPLVAERKWFIEMKRFDEHFTALDGRLLRHCLQETHLDGAWPEQYAKAILPFSLVDSDLLIRPPGGHSHTHPGLLKLDTPPKFDLIIVDEAHHIRNPETLLHQGVRFLCDNAGAVIFLTATPVQLGSQDLYTLLNVLRPDLIIDHASFEQMAAPNRHINTAVQHCRAAREGWHRAASASLDEVASTDWGRLFIRESPAFQSIYDRLHAESIPDTERIALIRAIEDLYTFSPLINRTRRRDIGEFTTRKPETLSVEFTPAQRKLHDDLLALVARILEFCHDRLNVAFMMSTIRRQAASCLFGLAPLLQDILAGKLDRLDAMDASDTENGADFSFVEEVRSEIAAILELSRNLGPQDPKVEAFIKVLQDKNKLPNNKALVFSTFRHTLAYLHRHVQETGLRCGLIHGGVSEDERADLRRRFALPKEQPEAIDVCLSSEVGCEGLDFQFCDLLVNYDLPWNPMRIEQRIGRLDRYGQKSETVVIVNLITPGTVDADIYERCLWRIGVFQHAIGGNEEILGQITRAIQNIAESFTLTAEERSAQLRQIADNNIRVIREEQDLEARQAELFGLNVPGQYWRQQVEAAESYWLSPQAMQRCLSTYLSLRLGTETDPLLGKENLKTLRLSQEARLKLLDDFKCLPRSTEPLAKDWEKWLKGAQPTLAVTLDQQTATANPGAVYLSVTHPLLRQAARFLQLDESASVSLFVQSSAVPPGNYPFALYRWQMHGVKRDEILVPVVSAPAVEDALLNLLQCATDASPAVAPSQGDLDTLDAQHHAKWTVALANHIAENRQLVEHRIQSLTVSHRARTHAIETQIAAATNDKIRLMKTSELARANADFTRHLAELKKAADGGDIHASPVLFGTLTVRTEGVQ
ncbi:MAG: helicase-related protein [Verrucomicrobiota bacterium]